MDMPEWMFARGLASSSAEAMTYECPVHGIILPRKFANGYRRRECPCQWEQRQAESVTRYQEAMQHALGTKQAERCYTWLGRDAQEIGLEEKTFLNFDWHVQEDAYRTCLNYKPAHGEASLLLMGSVGTGKTHLAAAILNGLREQGVPCLFATVQNLFNALYAASFDGKLSIMEQVGSTKLAVLDDMDKSKADGEYQKGVLFDIIDRRYKRKLPTIITTNAQTNLEHWLNEATLDRLYERCEIVPMNGKSYRRVLAEQHNQRQN